MYLMAGAGGGSDTLARFGLSGLLLFKWSGCCDLVSELAALDAKFAAENDSCAGRLGGVSLWKQT